MQPPVDSRESWFKGQGLWKDVPEADWKNWKWQLKNRITKVETLEKYLDLSAEERAGCLFANKKLALAITPYFFNLVDREDPECPIRKQVIPRGGEMQTAPEEMLDPVGEEETMPVKGLVHRYPDRVLFLVTDRCASYCRYCTRSRLVSNAQDYNFHPEFESGLKYIEEHPEVRDVLLSGGDPLLMSDRKLDYLLGRLSAIPHVQFVRIGSRIPVFLPQRITPELCDIFRRHGPIWMSIHVNHPLECTEELREATDYRVPIFLKMGATRPRYDVAIAATGLGMIGLVVLKRVERLYPKDSYRMLTIVAPIDVDTTKIIDLVKDEKLKILNCDIEKNYETGRLVARLSIRLFHRGVIDKLAHGIIESLEASSLELLEVKWDHT